MATPVALVTASSAGLGAATAKEFARLGYQVVVNYKSNKEQADQVLQSMLQLAGPNGTFTGSDQNEKAKTFVSIRADMSSQADIKRMVQKVIDKFGRLDCVVSNHGWTQMRDFGNLDENMDESDWELCFLMNVTSHLHLFHAVKPHLKTARGSFVTIASLAGVIPSGSSIVSFF
jgi:NAD(P)-dependent dehydrogenase (short-subunit alcohol dehydrogenase family)